MGNLKEKIMNYYGIDIKKKEVKVVESPKREAKIRKPIVEIPSKQKTVVKIADKNIKIDPIEEKTVITLDPVEEEIIEKKPAIILEPIEEKKADIKEELGSKKLEKNEESKKKEIVVDSIIENPIVFDEDVKVEEEILDSHGNPKMIISQNKIIFERIVSSAHKLDSIMREKQEVNFDSEYEELRSLVINLSKIDRDNDLESLIKIENQMEKLRRVILEKIFADAVDNDIHNRNIIYYTNRLKQIDNTLEKMGLEDSKYFEFIAFKEDYEERLVNEIVKSRDERLLEESKMEENPFKTTDEEKEKYLGYTKKEYHKILTIMHK